METSCHAGTLILRRDFQRCLSGSVDLRVKGTARHACLTLMSVTHMYTLTKTSVFSLPSQTWLLHFVPGWTRLFGTSLWASKQPGQPMAKLYQSLSTGKYRKEHETRQTRNKKFALETKLLSRTFAQTLVYLWFRLLCRHKSVCVRSTVSEFRQHSGSTGSIKLYLIIFFTFI